MIRSTSGLALPESAGVSVASAHLSDSSGQQASSRGIPFITSPGIELSPRSGEAAWSTERAIVVREDILADISPVAGSQQLVVTGSVLASTNQLSTGQPRKRGHDSSSEDLATEAPLVRQKHIADILNATDMEDVD